jgi:hypothetical protein
LEVKIVKANDYGPKTNLGNGVKSDKKKSDERMW